jgi:murein L,D-transpeptidase YcbB/YkuD
MAVLRRGGHGSFRLTAVLALLSMPLGAAAQTPTLSAPPSAVVPAAVTIPALTPAQAALAMSVLQDADSQGLAPRDYLPEGFGAAPLGDSDLARLTPALLRYARDVHVGRMRPGEFPQLWGLRPAPFDPAPGLAEAVAANRLGPWLASLPPAYSGYNALRRALAKYRAIARQGGWRPIPAGPAIGPGAAGPRVRALRARLAAEDQAVSAVPGAYDAALQQALARAQRRFGLKPDGVLDASTLGALNQPVAQRILQIVANMERWRWMPPQMPPTRVQVNAGAAIVTLFKDDRPVLSMKAVSGKVGDETPMLQASIHSIVLNPPWNVPTSIATKELWPKERAHPGYLAREGFVVIATPDGGKRLQQKPEKSALGRYKFDFENAYGVYLHDTPARGGFDRLARQASHGCVRLEKPAALAEALLADDPAWTPGAIAEAVDSKSTQRVQLPADVPVFILYWTAFASADGQMNFRADPYSWDRLLLQRVGVLAPSPN